ncbi:MAG TPA: polysaccharide deacetylase family protein [Cytophagaceae bacterium]|jgi:peptidoglycan/xylan/chitin deacetylase (PgdA/CDA1 family)
MKKLFVSLLLMFNGSLSFSQPTLSFTFDDGSTDDMPGYSFQEWNDMLLGHMDKAGIKSVFFVKGQNKGDEKGQLLLKSWNDKGHKIANHTFTHPNYNKKETTYLMFRDEFLKNDSLIRKLSNYYTYFRFPYLKEGDTKEKVESFRALMKAHQYKNGHVTIDASDWYIDSRLKTRLWANPKANIEGFRQFYLDHLYDRAKYYEQLSFKLTGRHVNHTLLLHHNLAASLFLGDLIKMFKDKGWKIVDGAEAFKDKIYKEAPSNIPAGESLIWGLAKQSREFESTLRYPAEDSKYEKEKMDQLGL